MKTNISKQGNQNATMLNQKIGSALDIKTNEDFNNQKPNPNDPSFKAKIIYTCPMHPEVQMDTPGKCPKCGMQLVENK